MLVITEVALSLILVFAAGLLAETMARLHGQNPGFRADHLLIAHVFIPPARYPDPDAITRFCDTFGERVRSVPGVVDASVTTGYPRLSGGYRCSPFQVCPCRERLTFR